MRGLLYRDGVLGGDRLAAVEPGPDVALPHLSPGDLLQFPREIGLPVQDSDGAFEGFDAHGRESYYFGGFSSTTNVVGGATTALVVSPAMVDLAENIRKMRLAAGLSQVALAERAGVSQQLINKLETGKALESRKLTKIAAALGVTAEQLAADQYLGRQVREAAATYWPFELEYQRFARLPERERIKIEGVVENMVREAERSLAGAQVKSESKKRRRA